MRQIFFLSIVVLLVEQIVAPPVSTLHEEETKHNEINEQGGDSDTFEYERYLKEIIQALESDSVFRAKLDKAQEADIRSGKIAAELEYVSHHVRTKLDEAKRRELERLKQLVRKKRELNTEHELSPNMADHLNHINGHTFEIEDLQKLIHKTNEDLAENDKKRQADFKEYEMQKHFEEAQKMKGLTEEEKKKYAEESKTKEEKHKNHEPLHHPGSKKQLEEVWEKQDHMDQEFNPRTFFVLHDVDGNGYWDQDEVKALFLKELDKMYNENPEDDARERIEEMERMREHVFSEADTNHDGLIDYDEFEAQTKKAEYQNDPGWKPLDEQELYSPEEYQAFEKQREQEIQKMIAQGLIPSHPDYGHNGQFPPQHADPNQIHHQGQVPVQQQTYQGQVPVHQQQHQQQYPVPVQNQHPPTGQAQPQYHVPQGQPIQQQQQQQHQQQYPVPVQNQHLPTGQAQPQHQVPQGQPIQQQQYQPHVQQVAHHQLPPSGQFQPNVAQQAINNQHVQGNIPVANQQHQPVQAQNIQHQPPQATGQLNGAHIVSPNVVKT